MESLLFRKPSLDLATLNEMVTNPPGGIENAAKMSGRDVKSYVEFWKEIKGVTFSKEVLKQVGIWKPDKGQFDVSESCELLKDLLAEQEVHSIYGVNPDDVNWKLLAAKFQRTSKSLRKHYRTMLLPALSNNYIDQASCLAPKLNLFKLIYSDQKINSFEEIDFDQLSEKTNYSVSRLEKLEEELEFPPKDPQDDDPKTFREAVERFIQKTAFALETLQKKYDGITSNERFKKIQSYYLSLPDGNNSDLYVYKLFGDSDLDLFSDSDLF